MAKPAEKNPFPQLPVASLEAWRGWLSQNHATSEGVWLVNAKKNSGLPRVEEPAAIEEALCWGWIDSLPRSLDEQRSMLMFTPRKLKSNWSAINKERATRMIQEGRMKPAGQAKIDHAKANGQWDALDGVDALEIPEDLAEAFKLFAESEANFSAFPRSAKRGILEWILNAKGVETRAKRVNDTARLASENIRANQWSRLK